LHPLFHYSLAQTWLARAGFYDFGSPNIATTALYSRQLAPGQAGFQGRSSVGAGSKILQQQQLIPGKSRSPMRRLYEPEARAGQHSNCKRSEL